MHGASRRPSSAQAALSAVELPRSGLLWASESPALSFGPVAHTPPVSQALFKNHALSAVLPFICGCLVVSHCAVITNVAGLCTQEYAASDTSFMASVPHWLFQ